MYIKYIILQVLQNVHQLRENNCLFKKMVLGHLDIHMEKKIYLDFYLHHKNIFHLGYQSIF